MNACGGEGKGGGGALGPLPAAFLWAHWAWKPEVLAALLREVVMGSDLCWWNWFNVLGGAEREPQVQQAVPQTEPGWPRACTGACPVQSCTPSLQGCC